MDKSKVVQRLFNWITILLLFFPLISRAENKTKAVAHIKTIQKNLLGFTIENTSGEFISTKLKGDNWHNLVRSVQETSEKSAEIYAMKKDPFISEKEFEEKKDRLLEKLYEKYENKFYFIKADVSDLGTDYSSEGKSIVDGKSYRDLKGFHGLEWQYDYSSDKFKIKMFLHYRGDPLKSSGSGVKDMLIIDFKKLISSSTYYGSNAFGVGRLISKERYQTFGIYGLDSTGKNEVNYDNTSYFSSPIDGEGGALESELCEFEEPSIETAKLESKYLKAIYIFKVLPFYNYEHYSADVVMPSIYDSRDIDHSGIFLSALSVKIIIYSGLTGRVRCRVTL